MAKMIIQGIYTITDTNEDLFYDIWDENYADPVKILKLVQSKDGLMKRIDHADQPYRPNPQQDPRIVQLLWAVANDPSNTQKMIGLFAEITDNNSNGLDEVPVKWILGQSAPAIVVYKKSCCPEYSAMLCGEFEDGFEFVIKDSKRTHNGEGDAFAKMVSHDQSGRELAHAYQHIMNRDQSCDHDHKPRLK